MTKLIVSNLELVDKFKELTQASEDGFLIVAPQKDSDVYVQFTYSSEELYCEAVSNEYLPKKKQLTETKIGLLKQQRLDYLNNGTLPLIKMKAQTSQQRSVQVTYLIW
ncbi:MAG: TY-Chap domain-containing protein [Candidatus Heimdallarchaeaceae archaeon]